MTDEELIERLRWRRESLDAAAADRIEALVKERDEATNQLDSARHSVDVLEKRVEALVKERGQWIEHTKNAVWADSEELKLANARAERLEAAGKAYREATRHLKPCPETAAGFDAALKGDGHVGT